MQQFFSSFVTAWKPFNCSSKSCSSEWYDIFVLLMNQKHKHDLEMQCILHEKRAVWFTGISRDEGFSSIVWPAFRRWIESQLIVMQALLPLPEGITTKDKMIKVGSSDLAAIMVALKGLYYLSKPFNLYTKEETHCGCYKGSPTLCHECHLHAVRSTTCIYVDRYMSFTFKLKL